MKDFFKALLERLRIEFMLCSLAVAILIFKIFKIDAWWMIFVFCVTYLGIVFIDAAIKRTRETKLEVRRRKQLREQDEAENELTKEQIWQRFYSLDAEGMKLLIDVYKGERDPHNPCVRYFRNGSYIGNRIESNSNFCIYKGNSSYYPLLFVQYMESATVVTFAPYLLQLTEMYYYTGIRNRE